MLNILRWKQLGKAKNHKTVAEMKGGILYNLQKQIFFF